MKLRLFLMTALLAVFSTSLFAVPKPKYKSIWLSGCACYDGYQLKKIPDGEGKLTVYNSQDIKINDVITGKFNDNNVTGATLKFAGGLEYKGDLSYKLLSNGIEYTLTGGHLNVYRNSGWSEFGGEYESFEVKPQGEKICFEVASNDVVTIFREYNGFKTKHNPFKAQYTSYKISNTSKSLIREFAVFINPNYKFREIYDVFLQITDTDYWVDSNKKKQFKLFVDTTKYFECSVSSHDIYKYALQNEVGKLSVSYQLWSGVEAFYRGTEFLERHMDGGVITASSSLEKKEWKELLSSENQGILSTLKHWPQNNLSKGRCTEVIKVKYSDGSVYTGRLYTEYHKPHESEVSNTIGTILSCTNLPDRTQYDCGVLEYPDGKQIGFVNGFTLDDAIAYSQNEEKERNNRELARKRAEEEEERAKQKELQQLRDKYGQYFDTIYDSNGSKILVGTPFELIKTLASKNILSYTLEIDNGSSKCYDWYTPFILGRHVREGYFWISNGKVTTVSYY